MNPTAGLRRDTEVSFPDGNAIIIAGDTLFRVYNGLLARHCPALAAQVSASAETIDGCPAIRVTDMPYDITQIPGLRRVDPSAGSEPFSVLAAWVRIGTKYDMGKLIDYALAQLESLFPTSLAEWDERGSLESRYARMIEESRKKFKWSQCCSYTWAFDGCYDVILDLAYTEEEDGKEAWRDGDPLDSTFTGYIDDREDGEDYESREYFADYEEVRDELAEMRAVVWNDLPAIAGVDARSATGVWVLGV